MNAKLKQRLPFYPALTRSTAIVPLVFTIGIACPSDVPAAAITYTVEPMSLSDGYVIHGGQITTTGIMGSLEATDILSFEVQVGSFLISQLAPNWSEISGSVTATPYAIEISSPLPGTPGNELHLGSLPQGCGGSCPGRTLRWFHHCAGYDGPLITGLLLLVGSTPVALQTTLDYGDGNSLIVATVPDPEADFDGDADVDGDDFLAWQTGYPTASAASKEDGDYDNDGDVDGDDFLGWQTEYPSPGSGWVGPAVPEPTSILLVIAAVVGVVFRSRSVSPTHGRPQERSLCSGANAMQGAELL